MADFTWTPIRIRKVPEKFNINVTPTESMKRRYYEIDSNMEELFELDFGFIQRTGAVNGVNRDDIHDHYVANKSFYSSFSWTSVPAWISGSPVTARYESYNEDPPNDSDFGGELFHVTVVLRKEV